MLLQLQPRRQPSLGSQPSRRWLKLSDRPIFSADDPCSYQASPCSGLFSTAKSAVFGCKTPDARLSLPRSLTINAPSKYPCSQCSSGYDVDRHHGWSDEMVQPLDVCSSAILVQGLSHTARPRIPVANFLLLERCLCWLCASPRANDLDSQR